MVIPLPAERRDGSGTFDLAGATVAGATPVAAYLAAALRLEVGAPVIELVLEQGHPAEGYRLEVDGEGIRMAASTDEGLFRGAQTLRQLAVGGRVPVTVITDSPRYSYRGAMLDVARHFLPVAAVIRYLDDIALLKINHLHLHLTDDQGWRIQVDSWPELTGIGASTQVGGGGGGHYTKDDYRRIVEHAASRFITIVPEIDMPGHTNAAIAAYPELGDSPAAPYEGIEVGFSSLAIREERSYEFVDDVVREVAELTPGPFLHLGGDESLSTSDEDFRYFIGRATAVAARYGKTLIGWHEMGRSRQLPPGTIGQYWSFVEPQDEAAEHARSFIDQGGGVIMSPADVAYLDMKYTGSDERGLVWAGTTSLAEAYGWDPDDIIAGVAAFGVEAPVWTETLTTIEDVELMAFPRLAAIAEIAWSPRHGRSFADFGARLGRFGAVMDAAGIRYTRVPGISWPAGPPGS